MRFHLLALAALFFSSMQTVALAAVPPPTMTISETEETVFSIGLRFSFGDLSPEVVGAVRNTVTDTSSDVTGIQFDVAVPLFGENPGMPKVRLLGLLGDRNILGQAGVGFNFGSNQPMVSGGVQGPNVEGGINVELDGGFDPFIGLNLFDRPSGPTTTTIPPS